ncbi:hypothetical protein N9L68_05695 [bacterium]|nr:hypothetical protein [bacterium]
MISGNAADDASVKCLAAMPLGMLFFPSDMPSGNAAPPRTWKLLSLRADVGLKRKGRLRARQTRIQAAARWRHTYFTCRRRR